MANNNSEKALLGFAMSSNSLLHKVEAIQDQTKDTLLRIEGIAVANLSVTRGIAVCLTENNKVLKEIKELISKKSEIEKAKFGGSGGMSKLLGLGGFIALTGIGMIGLAMAFQEAGKVTMQQIISGVSMFVAVGTIAKLLGMLAEDKNGSIISNFGAMRKLVITMGMSMSMMVAMSLALNTMKPVSGDKLVAALAIGAVIYIMGQTFVQLIKAWEFSGIMNFMLNKNNTDDIMRAMFLMSLQMVVLAGAMNLMPSVATADAYNFVIVAAAMLPLSVALVAMRFALPAIQKIDIKTIGKAGLAVAMLGVAMVPIAFAAKLIGKVGISEAEISKLISISIALAPLVAVITLLSAIINFSKEGRVGKNQMGQNNSLLKMDNSRKRNQAMNGKDLVLFAKKAVAIIGVLAIASVAFAAAAPMIKYGAQAARSIDMIGVLKLMFTLGGFLLIGGLVIGMTMKMIKGKEKSSIAGKFPLMGSSSSKPGELTKNDLTSAMWILPMIVLSMAAATLAFKLMPTIPKLEDGFLEFVLISGIAMFIYGFVMAKVFNALSGKDKGPGAGKFGFGGSSSRASLGYKDIIKAGFAMSVVALAIVGVAYIFKLLPAISADQAPPLEWTLKAGLTLLIFTGAFAALALLADKVGLGGLVKGALALPLAALGILAVAYLFQWLPDKFNAPTLDWSIDAALSIAVFGIPLVLLGLAALPSAGLALLLGAAGMILIAGTIWVVAHIFNNLPTGFAAGAKEAATALFTPIDAMTESLALMKNKIGIDNMIPLGKGLLAIAAGWLALSAAMAGKAIGGLVEGLASGAGKLLDVMTMGATKTAGPFEVLDMLISKSEGLIKIGPAVANIGKGMISISLAGFKATSALRQINKTANLHEEMKNASYSIARIGRGYTEIAKASRMMSVPAIEASAKMFNAIADIAKMKGEDAMSVLAKELMSAVVELSKIVDKLDTNVTKQPEGLAGAMDSSMQKFIDKIKGKTAEVEGEIGESSLIDITPIVEAIQELEDRFMRPIRVQEV